MTLMNKLYCSKGKPKPSQHFEFYSQIKNPEIPGLLLCIIPYINSIVKAILNLCKQLLAHSSMLFLTRRF